jgi:hypothetical protein
MPRPNGISARTSPGRDHRPDGQARPRPAAVATICLIAAVLGFLSALTPWWFLTTTTAGSSTTVGYLPGTVVEVVTNGGGGRTTYSGSGVPSVGALYGFVLAAELAASIVALLLSAHAFTSALGRWASARTLRAARGATIGALAVGVLLLVAVPTLQPALYRTDNPAGVCSATDPVGPCKAFWGSGTTSGGATDWGAGSGWWLDLAVSALFGVSLLLQRRRSPSS